MLVVGCWDRSLVLVDGVMGRGGMVVWAHQVFNEWLAGGQVGEGYLQVSGWD